MSFLSQFYGVVTQIKNDWYNRGFLDQIRVPSKVISIGNLTVGGTGKTPLTDLILTQLQNRGLKTAVVSRAYKALSQSPGRVQIGEKDAVQKYGDEATWLASRHPGIPVYVGPRKSQTLPFCFHHETPDVIVIDDGFQHRAAHRDLDIVLIDASAPAWQYELLPSGRLREGFSSLHRANLVLLTKLESATTERVEALRFLIQKTYRGPSIETRQVMDFPGTPELRVFAFCGIGQPDSFERALREHYRSVEFQAFPDHHNYRRVEIQELVLKSRAFDLVLTTEKDEVKLKDTILGSLIKSVPLRVEFVKGESEFYATLDSILR